MKLFRALAFAVLLAGVGFAQTGSRVEGRVIQDGRGVPNATATLVSTVDKTKVYSATTNSNGDYVFNSVPPGTYTASASIQSEGQSRQSRPTTVTVTGDATATIDLQLVRMEPLRESVTISIDAPQDQDEVSKSVDIISAQEMRDRADFTLVDTVRTIPGFRVQQLGGFGRTASIKSRGLRNQDTAVLIDGIRFRDPGSITGDATPFLGDFTLTSVSRIEILRGSGSSLYGTNAIGGTIDFQTPEARKGIHGQVSGAAGGLGLGRFRSNLSYGGNKFGITGAVSRTAYTDGIDGDDNASNTNFQSRIDYSPFSRTNISARFFVSDARVRLNSSPDTLGSLPPVSTIIDAREGVNFVPDVDDPDSIQKANFFSGQFAITQAVASKLVLHGFYQGLNTERTNDDGLLGTGFQSAFTSSFGGTIHTANAHGVWSPNSSNTLTAGYEFEVEHFRNAGSATDGMDSFRTRAGQRSNTIYAQHVAGFLDDRLHVAGGFRAQWFSLERPQFSSASSPYDDFVLADPPAAYTFDGSASYFIPQTQTKLRVHAGNGYRVPSLYERFGTFFFFGAFFPQGNPLLKPERSIGIDAGVEQYFAKDRMKASATWFYTRIKDEITYLPTDDFGSPVYYNFDRHYSRGAELSLDIKPTKSTDIFASYTFTNSDIRNFRRPTIVSLASADRKSFGIPDHQFTMVVTQRIKRFWISGDLLATSSYLAPVFSSATFNQYTYRFEGNRRVDLTAGYTFPLRRDDMTLRLFGTIENVFDDRYFENGFRTIPRNGRVGLSFGF